MKVDFITACSDRIILTVTPKSIPSASVRAFVPLVQGSEHGPLYLGRCVYEWTGEVQNGAITLPRRPGYDLLICRFEAESGGQTAEGVQYVTDFGR